MFILGVVTLGSSSLTLMEPTLPLYLQTTYKVQQRGYASAAATAAPPYMFVSMQPPNR
jgi:hypothetical protein